MRRCFRRSIGASLALAGLAAACTHGSQIKPTPAPRSLGAAVSPAAMAAADRGRPPYTRADVHFMLGMIGHHGQAVVMAGWAPSHGASASIKALAERIVVAQRDEIGYMRRWLGDRSEVVPSGDQAQMPSMPGMDHAALMPGMLTADQLAELERAGGAVFDRLFLRFMIQHHQGALTMVADLLAASGGQDEDVFKFISDVNADQTTEIDFMSKMLTALPAGAGPQ